MASTLSVARATQLDNCYTDDPLTLPISGARELLRCANVFNSYIFTEGSKIYENLIIPTMLAHPHRYPPLFCLLLHEWSWVSLNIP
jgi:hypothetical protein